MLKTLVMLGLFVLILGSGIVIKDWDNPGSEVLVNADNIIDENYNTFTFNPLQCSETISYCPSIINYNLNKKPYQQKNLIGVGLM